MTTANLNVLDAVTDLSLLNNLIVVNTTTVDRPFRADTVLTVLVDATPFAIDGAKRDGWVVGKDHGCGTWTLVKIVPFVGVDPANCGCANCAADREGGAS